MNKDSHSAGNTAKSRHLCFIGNMLGRNPSYNTTQGQIVADLFAAEGYQVTCASSKINRLARLSDIILTLIKNRKKIDLVLLEVYSGLYFVIAQTVAALSGIFNLPLVMILHGGNLPEFIQKYPGWTKRTLKKADALVAPSEFLADYFRKNGYEVCVIPNVVDTGSYQFKERSEISPKLIWMRSFHPIYNPEMAIKVLARLRQTHREATLTMAGNDKGLEKEIRLLAEKLGVSEAVRFTGFLTQEKKIQEFSAADIYINTNLVDNMPVSVIEACALGLPVVATDVGGLPYLIDQGENGFLSPSEDVEAMVQNIEKLLNDPELTQKISKNGRALAENSSWTNVRQKFEKLIAEILKTESSDKISGWFAKANLASEKNKN